MHERRSVTISRQVERFCAVFKSLGAVIGISIGCIAGMFPLLLMNKKKESDCDSESSQKDASAAAAAA